MKIEYGKTYLTRSGREVKIVTRAERDAFIGRVINDGYNSGYYGIFEDNGVWEAYNENGILYIRGFSEYDIVSEVKSTKFVVWRPDKPEVVVERF